MVSYCCTQNVENIIRLHNKKLINSSNHHAEQSQPGKKIDYPSEQKCRTENIIYKCHCTKSDQIRTYITPHLDTIHAVCVV